MRSTLNLLGLALSVTACTPGVGVTTTTGAGGAAMTSGATSGSSSGSGNTAVTSTTGAGATTGTTAASTSASTGSGCPAMCPPLDQCHLAGTCNMTTHTCTNPAKPNGASCMLTDPCMMSAGCQNGVCTGAQLFCGGGQTCVGGACVCPLGQLVCGNTNQCEPATTACTDLGCGLCGTNPACDGQIVSDPISGYMTTCAASFGTCDAAHAQASNAPDQQEYNSGANYSCVKQNGVYGWHRRVKSANLGGPGCLTAYAHCTYVCTANFNSYAGYCDSMSNFDTNLAGAAADGCPQLSPVPQSYVCP